MEEQCFTSLVFRPQAMVNKAIKFIDVLFTISYFPFGILFSLVDSVVIDYEVTCRIHAPVQALLLANLGLPFWDSNAQS
ncbi:hypothetical protein VNO80_25258 [Phaseolus coccineus]|uniref:Uncharacterized protein n=1 Tax=Phaseolus coccineus TaxID=3886 RepID=A0AAN9LUY0_PHACN